MHETTKKLIWYTDKNRPTALHVSSFLQRSIERIGKAASWLILPMIVITAIDVLIRKLTWRDESGHIIFGVQNYLVNNISEYFGSTLLQEMEWHFHTALFVLALAYGYVSNCHVRVDLIREKLNLKTQAWIEILGVSLLLIPFVAIMIYNSADYAYISYINNEISASNIGLSHRWVIKCVLFFGFIFLMAAAIAVLLECITLLKVGSNKMRFKLMTLEWPEEAGTSIEGKKRIVLSEVEPGEL